MQVTTAGVVVIIETRAYTTVLIVIRTVVYALL